MSAALAVGGRCPLGHPVVACPACGRPGCLHESFTRTGAWWVNHAVGGRCAVPDGWAVLQERGLVRLVRLGRPAAPTAAAWAAAPRRAIEL